jgi:hypothetical protein
LLSNGSVFLDSLLLALGAYMGLMLISTMVVLWAPFGCFWEALYWLSYLWVEQFNLSKKFVIKNKLIKLTHYPDPSVIAILNVREIVWLYASCLLFHGNTPVVPLRKELVVLSLL